MGFQVATRRVFGAGGFQVVKPTAAAGGGGAPPSGYITAVDTDTPTQHWRLGETSGTSAADRIAAADGTYTNGVTLGVTGALASDADKAARFAGGSSQSVVLPNLTVGANASWEAWFKIASGQIGTIFCMAHDTGVGRVTVAVTPRFATQVTNDAGSNTFIDGPFGKDDNAWHHAVLTQAGLVYVLYCDGSQVATGTATGTVSLNRIRLGANTNDTVFWTGDLDEAAIYATALNSTRVAAHNTAGIT